MLAFITKSSSIKRNINDWFYFWLQKQTAYFHKLVSILFYSKMEAFFIATSFVEQKFAKY